MNLKCWATAAVFCVLAAPGALAQKAAPGDSPAAARSWPLLPPGKSPKSGPAAEWSREEVEAGHARCTALLKGLNVVAVPEVPLREGAQCGTPAPMKLISVGQITLSPPAVLTCDMIVALHKWLQRDVQALAVKHLGGPITRIDSMSSYSCRNAYGRPDSRLSEHARANALDIGSFVTSRGQRAAVVADWGLTARDIKAAAADKADPMPALAGVAAPPPVAAAAAAYKRPAVEPHQHAYLPATPVVTGFQSGIAISIPGLTVDLPGHRPSDFSFGPMNRLGGPKTTAAVPHVAAPAAVSAGSKMDFLREAHRAACKIFGTVLGPEANTAHKNHFHVDMAERRQTGICE